MPATPPPQDDVRTSEEALARVGLTPTDLFNLGYAAARRKVPHGGREAQEEVVGAFLLGACRAALAADPARPEGAAYVKASGYYAMEHAVRLERRRRGRHRDADARSPLSLDARREEAEEIGSLLDFIADPKAPAPGGAIADEDGRRKLRAVLKEILDELPHAERERFVGWAVEGKTLDELGRLRRRPVSRQAVSQALGRTRRELAGRIREDFPDLELEAGVLKRRGRGRVRAWEGESVGG